MARFSVTACHVQMKGKAYNKFSLPPNKKATAGKARALRQRGGARNPPRRPQRNLSKTNQSISQSLPLAESCSCKWQSGLSACQALVFKSFPPLAIKCTKMLPARLFSGSTPYLPSLSSLHTAGKPLPTLEAASAGFGNGELLRGVKEAPGALPVRCLQVEIKPEIQKCKGPRGVPRHTRLWFLWNPPLTSPSSGSIEFRTSIRHRPLLLNISHRYPSPFLL